MLVAAAAADAAARSARISLPPPAPDVNGYTPEPLAATTASAATPGGEAQRFVRDLDLPGQWWTLFHSKALNSLIEKALAANPDLQAAQAALRVAKENVYAQQGALFPSIDGNFAGSRQKFAIGAAVRRRLRIADLQSLHRATEHLLCARRVRRHPALDRGAGGAGGFPALRSSRRPI